MKENFSGTTVMEVYGTKDSTTLSLSCLRAAGPAQTAGIPVAPGAAKQRRGKRGDVERSQVGQEGSGVGGEVTARGGR